jgi:iron complex outermembrane recepter protein
MPRIVPTKIALVSACSMLALFSARVEAAQAQETANLEKPNSEPANPEQTSADDRQIVVIGNRTIIASIKDVQVEQTYDADRIGSYGASTIGELLDNLTTENGDTAPSVLVNGQPVSDIGDLSDFPIEAISRIEALPRGAASRIGGPAGQRAYNVVLKSSVKSVTLTASGQFATEGDWHNYKGEALFTYIKGQDRVNLTLRAADSDFLFNADRNIIPLPEFIPFAATGNIVPQSGSEIDPVFSAFAGQSVRSVALPSGNTRPTASDLLNGINQINPSNLGNFRTLRGANQPYEVSIAGNKKLATWLTLSFNGRLNWSQTTGQSGLPAARFLIPATNVFTPFSRPVLLALNDPARPLQNISDSTNGSISATFNANFGPWRVTVAGRHDVRDRKYSNERVGTISGGFIAVDMATNPFDGTLAGLIPVTMRTTRSKTVTSQISEDAEGPLFNVPAGSVRLRAGMGLIKTRLDASDSTGANDRSFRRRELSTKAGITIPLTTANAQSPFLSFIGETELSMDVARLNLGRFGKLDRHSIALNWRPIEWLSFTATQARDGSAISPELLSSPTIVSDNVSFFDPLTGDTVDVTTISGGAANLRNQSQRTKTFSMTANPLRTYNVQLNATYLETDLIDQLGALPPPSTAVVAAFPDRFQRDGSGRLVLVDNRTVNFARQSSRELRTSIGFTIPFADSPLPSGSPSKRPKGRNSRTTLQINASHTFLLESTSIIRDGLDVINLLDGGAIGIGGGRQRNVSDASVALMRGATGVRLNAARRGVSFLRTGSVTAPDLLTYAPITKIDLRAFADLGTLFPKIKMAKGFKLTLTMENLAGNRQRITNAANVVPASFQPAYLDPIGRTVMVELRKVF